MENIKYGDSFTNDMHKGKRFDYMLANPPFGVEWKPQRDFIEKEHKEQGFGGRFGAGLPRINDGSLLFLQHMLSKMKPVDEGGTRLGIVFNASLCLPVVPVQGRAKYAAGFWKTIGWKESWHYLISYSTIRVLALIYGF
jgi:hypothetical protein